MSHAASSFLNQPLRTEAQARAAQDQAEQERRRRLDQHGAAFCRKVLAGAFERVYQTNGSYRLREIQSGAWLDDLTTADSVTHRDAPASSPLPASKGAPQVPPITKRTHKLIVARRSGYAAALCDLSRWIAEAAMSRRMDAYTLNALNDQIAKLAQPAKTATSSPQQRR